MPECSYGERQQNDSTANRNSHIFYSENGEEVLDENGEPTGMLDTVALNSFANQALGKWTCNRCKPGTFKLVSLSTTKNAINHLETQQGIDRKGQAIPGWKPKTYGQRTLQQFHFNVSPMHLILFRRNGQSQS